MNKTQELKIYRAFFHAIDLHYNCMNNEKVTEAVQLISRWSYAHRSGNGELTEHEQKQRVDSVIKRMEEFSGL